MEFRTIIIAIIHELQEIIAMKRCVIEEHDRERACRSFEAHFYALFVRKGEKRQKEQEEENALHKACGMVRKLCYLAAAGWSPGFTFRFSGVSPLSSAGVAFTSFLRE